jgi:hypothetical protein
VQLSALEGLSDQHRGAAARADVGGGHISAIPICCIPTVRRGIREFAGLLLLINSSRARARLSWRPALAKSP